MAISKVRLKAWFDNKITEPLVQILRRFCSTLFINRILELVT